MKTRVLSATVLAVALSFPAGAVVQVGPKATKWQSTVTTDTGTAAGIKITKTSKVSAKATAGSVTFALKLRGVTDNLDLPVTNTGNTFQVDLLIEGSTVTQMFSFDITNGKVSQKFPVANTSLPGGGVVPTEPIEIRRVRLIEVGSGDVFGVAGLTAR